MVRLYPQQVIQEIKRPTPSPLLPIDKEPGVNLDIISSWDKTYQVLVQYKDEFGTVNFSNNVVYQGYALGRWCSTQRRKFKEDKLKTEQKQKLEELGFAWDLIEMEWNRKYSLCVRYLSDSENDVIPSSAVFEGEKIGVWIETQRAQNKAGELSCEKKQKLDSLGLIWDPCKSEWDRKYNLCKCYLEETGRKRIPATAVFKGEKIGNWIRGQKRQNKAGRLSEERKQKLLQLYSDIFS